MCSGGLGPVLMGIRLLYFLVITLHTDSGPIALQQPAQDTALQGHCSNVRGHKNHKNVSDKLSLAVHYILCQEIRSAEHGQSGQNCHLMDLLESYIQTEDAIPFNMRKRGLN